MPRDSKVYLDDILQAAGRIGEYTRGLSREKFVADRRTLDAVIRNLEVIGEAAKQVPEEVRARCPQVEWKRLAGLRDILIHQYFGVDSEIIWDVVRNKVPQLEREVRKLLAE